MPHGNATDLIAGDAARARAGVGQRRDRARRAPGIHCAAELGLVWRGVCRRVPGGPLIALPKLGAAAVFSLVIAGQLIAALVVDSTGVFAAVQIPFSLPRGVGALLLLLGAILIQTH